MRTLTMFLAAGGIFFFALDTTLQEMTYHDCKVHNIELACRSLK